MTSPTLMPIPTHSPSPLHSQLSTKIAATYARVSSQDQEQESTSLDTQEAACLKLAKQHHYTVPSEYTVREVFSGLTTDRPKLKQVLQWVEQNLINALIIYSTDRFSRNGLDLLLLIKACNINNVELLCVTEDLGSGAIGELINYTRGWASQMEAAKIRERTMRGRIAHAQNNEIPGGFGLGYFGLVYDRSTKLFYHDPDQIHIVKEILHRYMNGDSISQITVDLQNRNIKGKFGRTIQRSGVYRVLVNADVYAGLLKWKEFILTGKIAPVITRQEALFVTNKIQQNRQRSYGLGQRKWLTGKVFCGTCSRRYALETRKGCHCAGDDLRNPIKCSSPRINLNRMNTLIYGVIVTLLTQPEVIIESCNHHHNQWQRQLKTFQHQQKRIDERKKDRETRRRLLSFQHEQGGLSNEEYLKRLSIINKEEATDNNTGIDAFTKSEPPPPEVVIESVNRIIRITQQRGYDSLNHRFHQVSTNPEDKVALELADMLDLKAVVHPPSNENQEFILNVMMKLPFVPDEMNSTVHQSQLPLMFTVNSDHMIEGILVGYSAQQ